MSGDIKFDGLEKKNDPYTIEICYNDKKTKSMHVELNKSVYLAAKFISMRRIDRQSPFEQIGKQEGHQ